MHILKKISQVLKGQDDLFQKETGDEMHIVDLISTKQQQEKTMLSS